MCVKRASAGNKKTPRSVVFFLELPGLPWRAADGTDSVLPLLVLRLIEINGVLFAVLDFRAQ
jgi:hypothetical protein